MRGRAGIGSYSGKGTKTLGRRECQRANKRERMEIEGGREREASKNVRQKVLSERGQRGRVLLIALKIAPVHHHLGKGVCGWKTHAAS